ncbi:hypothetical protein BD309DRAFT_958040 [Dichomitus squalens]|nr:hypothetical protein BD309DRAFT_958040 [Dichomitus squalens]
MLSGLFLKFSHLSLPSTLPPTPVPLSFVSIVSSVCSCSCACSCASHVSRLLSLSRVPHVSLCLVTLISVSFSESIATASTVYIYDLVGPAQFSAPNNDSEADDYAA